MGSGFFLLVCGCLLLVSIGLVVWSNESVHVVTFRSFGVGSHVEAPCFRNSTPACTVIDGNFVSVEDAQFAALGNSFAESVGYQLAPWGLAISLILVLGFVYLGGKLDAGRD